MHAILVNGRDRLLNFWRRITKQKLVITRELVTEKRVYSLRDMVLFSTSCTLGVNLWRSADILYEYGDVGCYCFLVCGAFQLITLMCYVELTAMQPCLGGAYHYAYNTSGQFVSFIVGWLVLSYYIASTATTFQMGSQLIDTTIFSGLISNNTRKVFVGSAMDEYLFASVIADYFDVVPLLLSISFCGMVAAETNDSKIISTSVSLVAFCLLNCLIIVLLGNAELGMWMKHSHPGAFFSSFIDVNTIMSAVYSLMFFGEEAKHPQSDIPAAMIWSYSITWFMFALFPTLILFNSEGLSFGSPTIFIDILKANNFGALSFAPQLGVTCAVYSSCFVELFSTVRLLVAMSRDGLMPKVFSKIEHFNKMPVKCTFLAGTFTGLTAAFFKTEFLINATNTLHLCFLLIGPILLLKQRYLYSIVHIEDKVTRKRRPNVYTGVVVFAGVLAFLTLGNVLYKPLAPYVVHPKAKPNYYLFVPPLCGSIAAGILIFLAFQPQNCPKSKFRVYGSPFVPAVMIIVYGYIFQFIPRRNFIIVGCWMVVGMTFYGISRIFS